MARRGERRWRGRRRRRQAGGRRKANRERGQATIELVAGLPALLLAALLALQVLAAGYALTLADGAAEAGALALASDHGATPAAREALPDCSAATRRSTSARCRTGPAKGPR